MNKENTPLTEKSKSSIVQGNIQENVLNVSKSALKKDDKVEVVPSILDEQWAEMSQDWQSQPVPTTDVIVLLKKTQRRNRHSKILFAADSIVTILLIISFIYGLYVDDWSTPTMNYLGFGSLASIGFVAYSFKIRLNAWNMIAQSPDKAIETAIATCKSSIQYLKMMKYSTYIFFLPMNWYVWEMSKFNDKPVLRGIIVANLILLVIYLWAHKRQLVRTQELQNLNETLLR